MLFALLFACTADKDPSPADDSPIVESAPPDPLDAADVATFEDEFSDALADQRYATGATVAIWKDGQVVYSGAFGTLDRESGVAVTTDTLFQVGSDTKKMTAIALLQQVQAGQLSLDTPVDLAIPGLALSRSPEWAPAATLHHLISHQGDLFDYTPWNDNPADAALAETAYGIFAENEYALAPGGSFYNYSNPNFSLAGLAVELAAGRAYADVLTQDLFGPLGMDHTYAREADLPAGASIATGHGYYYTSERDWFNVWENDASFQRGPVSLEDSADNGFVRPAGLVWSTAEDMARLAGFIVDGDPAVLDPALHAQISTKHVNQYPSIDLQGYGYGLFILQGFGDSNDGYHDIPFWVHGGNTLSMTSLFWVLPEQRIAISILSNGYGDDFSRAAALAFTLFGDLPAPVENPGFTTFEPDLEALIGPYVDPGLGTINVRSRGDGLSISIPALEDLGYEVGPELTPYLNEIFLFEISGTTYDITFVSDTEGGPPTWAVNRIFAGTRSSALLPVGPTLNRAQIEALLLAVEPGPPLPARP